MIILGLFPISRSICLYTICFAEFEASRLLAAAPALINYAYGLCIGAQK